MGASLANCYRQGSQRVTDTMTSPLVVASPDEVSEVNFDSSMEARIKGILKRYPSPGAALLPVLWLCQERWGWISPGTMEAVSQRLDLAPAFVEGVVSFYTMYQRSPPGKYLLQVCTYTGLQDPTAVLAYPYNMVLETINTMGRLNNFHKPIVPPSGSFIHG